jgi:tellurite resistance protein TehA-like permease
MVRHVKSPDRIVVPWDLPYGSRHPRPNDRIRLRSSLGYLGYNSGLDTVVDRSGGLVGCLFLSTLYDVRLWLNQNFKLHRWLMGDGSMSVHKTDISSVTTLWLLPIVSAVICAATGGMVAGVLPNPTHALWTVILSYILWGIGIPLAIFTLVLYYHRLTMHKIPPLAAISTVFLPLGPLGEGGFAIMKIGDVALTVFPQTNTIIPFAGQIVYVFGFLTALLMWGFALAWLFWALASFGRSKSPFNMGWWSIVFATGVFTGSTITLGQEMPSRFFDVLGTVSFCSPSMYRRLLRLIGI